MDGKTLDNKCPSCNASISFNPSLGLWKCEYCGSSFTLDELKKYDNASNDKVNNLTDDTEYDIYTCKDCGAEIIADENTSSTFCVYCGNTTILKNKLSGKFKPDKIIPFKKTDKDAKEEFLKLKKGRPLLPKDFLSEQNIEKIRGLYVPFWLYDVNVDGSLAGICTNIKTWTVGNTQYTKTDIYNVLRDGSMNFLQIPMDGSSRFDDQMMNSIEPFKYSELVDYNHAYLSGFLSEKYDLDSDTLFKNVKLRAEESAQNYFKSTIHYSTFNLTSNTLAGNEIKHDYALLPVFMVNVKYRNKPYLLAMNGQTGKIIGNLPISIKRTLVYSLIIFTTTFIVCLIISFIFYKVGA